MSWNLKEDLRDYLVAAAPYGGPIALMKNKKEKSPSSRPVLEIYSASGIQLASVVWKDSPAMFLGWTTSEELLSVQENGIVLLHSLFGEFKKKVTMTSVSEDKPRVEAEKVGSRRSCAESRHTRSLREASRVRALHGVGTPMPPLDFCYKPGLSGGRIGACGRRTTDCPKWCRVSCLSLLEYEPRPGKQVPLLLTMNRRELALTRAIESGDSDLVYTVISRLKDRLPRGDFFMALQNEPVALSLYRQSPKGNRMTLGHCDRYKCEYPLSEDSHLVPELDGVRIFSRSTHEFLHEIPEATEEIFKIASMSPGALLLEAQKEYEKESQKADEYLREIKDQKLLSEAVEQCIKAASYEHSPPIQKALLQAASFGKCFIDKFSPENFVETCRDLRVLNAVRDYQIGIPLSFDQYKQLTKEVLLDSWWILRDILDSILGKMLVLGLLSCCLDRFWWLKISALAEQGAWEDLEKFSKSKKSPIGYLPFAEISMKYGNRSEAKKYAARVTPEQKVKAFLLVGEFSQAADAAVERKNEAEMMLILSKCTDATVAAKLEQAKAQLGKK
ncbi:PREDICTED: vacuolar protein sorting-associated protein 16 homolog [Thamnophis sirtalis]|uniref:Vacuolar protein sorting-associated protein 16 homolog n=1 Tax=Thamnophis sirtalis TaxID=35019 RepID=A0A6I9YXH8_9SAUR|nr:PREDICTED: vacuolar protein sorting-associated protein 16 homolog [Thamnophis sirtalis]